LIGFGTNTSKKHLSKAFVEAICFKLYESMDNLLGDFDLIEEIFTDGLSEHP
jgi:glycerol kinase